MTFKPGSLRRRFRPVSCATVVLALILGFSFAGFQIPTVTTVVKAQSGETIEQFIRNAYAGVGQTPSCVQVKDENDTLVSLLPNTSSAFEQEARRFVSTLIETQASYNMPQTVFVETPAYSARNPADSGRAREFVTDLYSAFLQRTPDECGLEFWTSAVSGNASDIDPSICPNTPFIGLQGRRKVLDAFGSIPDDAEFTSLVHSLVNGGTPNCCRPRHCPSGYVWDPDICACSQF